VSAQSGYVAGEKRTTREILRELWGARSILWVLIKRDLKVRYADSALGYIWSVLEPLMMSAIYWFVFVLIFQRKLGGDPYIIFLLAGMLPWMWFTAGLTEGAKALRSQRKLIASTALPRQIWVFRSVCGKGMEFIFSVPVFIAFLIFYTPDFNGSVPLVLVGMLIQFVLLLGLGLLLSPVAMLYGDIEPMIRIVIRVLFYASPIIYGINTVFSVGLPRFVEVLYQFNPITGILEAYRSGFFAEPTRYGVIGISAVISVIVLIVGWVVFARMERSVLKEI